MKIKFLHYGVGDGNFYNGFETFKGLCKYVKNTTIEQHNNRKNSEPLLFCYETGAMYKVVPDSRKTNLSRPTKFNFEVFRDTETLEESVAFAKVKYSKNQAIEMARFEFNTLDELVVSGGTVRHRIGYIDGDKYIGWWLDHITVDGISIIEKGVPVWVVSRKGQDND